MYRVPSFDTISDYGLDSLDNSNNSISNIDLCSICTVSIKHRRVSCVKCKIQWCVNCYTTTVTRTYMKCPNCRMLQHQQEQEQQQLLLSQLHIYM